MVFGFTIAGNIFNGIVTISKGLGYLITVHGCNVFGIMQTVYFCYISVFIAFICISRTIAVSLPLVYRVLMTCETVKYCIGACSLISAGLSMLIIIPVDLNFKYIISSAGRVGCLPRLTKPNLQIWCAAFIGGIFFFDTVLLVTYCFTHFKFKELSSRESLKKLRKVVFRVSLSTTVSYIVCYSPTCIVYFLINIGNIDLKNISAWSAFKYDALLAFCAHFYALVLPLLLIYSKSLKQGKTHSFKLTMKNSPTFAVNQSSQRQIESQQ